MAFKTGKGSGASLDSPETLFNDLRSRKVKGLLAHQADILREYTKNAAELPDVALQMPTGSGKTLVGLLIAEWHRRKYGQSAVYLCPTNQLVHQVAEQATERYGIRVIPFTGPKSEYEAADKAEYQAAEAVAITSYSSLFNIRPFFEAPQIIVLDDAHSAENYIASVWSVRIERLNSEHKELFESLTAVLRPYLDANDLRKLTEKPIDRWDNSWIEKLPTPYYAEIIENIASILDTYAPQSDLRYSWSLLRNHLSACHLYLSAYDILIRPFIPPTFSHAPFSQAAQRIYMSATLGEGGDLERITGRKSIHRLRGPEGWEQQSIGRRFFIFAERSLDKIEAQKLYLNLMQTAGRTLFLVPDDGSADNVRDWIKQSIKYKLFTAKDIEQSKVAFVNADQAVAVVANRYDGIDLAEDECRLLFIEGLPGAVNLQERFLVSRMGAARVLDDRILTRIVQAFGRCTRSTTDYASVVICGEELNKYLLRVDRRQFFHPELQAELQFGINQSKESTANNFIDNLKLFLEQGDDWKAADAEIVQLRSSLTRKILPGTSELRAAVAFEVTYAQAMWSGNFDIALDNARTVLGKLNGDELKGYRAFWYYLAGSSSWLASMQTGQSTNAAREFFDHARKATSGVRWLYSLTKESHIEVPEESIDPLALLLVERIEDRFSALGTLNNKKYDELEQVIRQGIASDESSIFEQAQERLGWLLGYDSGRSTDQGAPDPWWLANENFCLVFEDHNEATERSSISVTKARQVSSHPNWITDHLSMSPNATIIPVLVTRATQAASEASPHLREVILWPLEAFREWTNNTLGVIRSLRTSFQEPGDLAWRADAATALLKGKIAPSALSAMLKNEYDAQTILSTMSGV